MRAPVCARRSSRERSGSPRSRSRSSKSVHGEKTRSASASPRRLTMSVEDRLRDGGMPWMPSTRGPRTRFDTAAHHHRGVAVRLVEEVGVASATRTVGRAPSPRRRPRPGAPTMLDRGARELLASRGRPRSARGRCTNAARRSRRHAPDPRSSVEGGASSAWLAALPQLDRDQRPVQPIEGRRGAGRDLRFKRRGSGVTPGGVHTASKVRYTCRRTRRVRTPARSARIRYK